jgi:hypothetical protein
MLHRVTATPPTPPSGLRDEFLDSRCGADAQLLAANAMPFEAFLVRENATGRFALVLGRAPAAEAIVHGHCHQQAFAAVKATAEVLGWIPGPTACLVDSSCCGIAGAFGYGVHHYDIWLHVARVLELPLGGAP